MKADRVMLNIVGKEKVAIRTRGEQRRTINAQRLFFTVALPLREYPPNEQIRPGNYAFPFSVMLPDSLPSSTSYPPGTNNMGLRIQYKMIGSIGKLHQKQPISIMSAPVPDIKVPAMIQPTSFALNSMGLFKKGTCTLGASVEDTHIGRGLSLDVHLACRNDSTENIRRVEVRLVETVQWHSTPGTFGHTRTAVLDLLHMNDIDLPGLSKERKNRREVRRSNSNRSLQESTYSEIFQDLGSNDNKIKLIVPTSARDSYSGQLIKIWHHLEIKLLTGRMANNPVTKVPIRIGSPPQGSRCATVSGTAAAIEATPATLPAPTQLNYRLAETEAVPVMLHVPESAPACYSQDSIPIVSAVAMSGETIYSAAVVHAPQEVIVLGGEAILVDQEGDSVAFERPPPVAPHSSHHRTPPSLANLMREMVFSVNDYDVIAARLRDPEWVPLFQAMSAQEFGSIIAHVNIDFDQPRVATLMAQHINAGRYFTCHYAAQAVKNTSEWNRSTMASELIPLCADIATHHALIRAKLNEWELIVTGRDFEDAIDRANYR